jgi:hypothetical protein
MAREMSKMLKEKFGVEMVDGRAMEPVFAADVALMLPMDIVTRTEEEVKEAMSKVMSMDVWNEKLTPEEREYLTQFLPPGYAASEVSEKVVKPVLGCADSGHKSDMFFFNVASPVDAFAARLARGHFHPLVARERRMAEIHSQAEFHYRLKQYHNLMVRSLKSSLSYTISSSSGDFRPKNADSAQDSDTDVEDFCAPKE